MKLNRYPSLARAAEVLKKRGFSDQFSFEEDALRHHQSNRFYDPEQVSIVEYHRFTSKSNHHRDRVSIIFALETEDNLRGLLVASYAAYGKVNLLEFMDRVKIKSRKRSTVG